jgi:hypothetical protein
MPTSHLAHLGTRTCEAFTRTIWARSVTFLAVAAVALAEAAAPGGGPGGFGMLAIDMN